MESGTIQFVGVPGVGKTSIIDKVEIGLKDIGLDVVTFEFGKELKSILKNRCIILNDGEIPERKHIEEVIKKCLALSQDKLVLMSGHLVHYNFDEKTYKVKTDIENLLNPKLYIFIKAKNKEIYDRRMSDSDKSRELGNQYLIKEHQLVTKAILKNLTSMLDVESVTVKNRDGSLDKTVKKIITILSNLK